MPDRTRAPPSHHPVGPQQAEAGVQGRAHPHASRTGKPRRPPDCGAAAMTTNHPSGNQSSTTTSARAPPLAAATAAATATAAAKTARCFFPPPLPRPPTTYIWRRRRPLFPLHRPAACVLAISERTAFLSRRRVMGGPRVAVAAGAVARGVGRGSSLCGVFFRRFLLIPLQIPTGSSSSGSRIPRRMRSC